jgi:hypothetical protein
MGESAAPVSEAAPVSHAHAAAVAAHLGRLRGAGDEKERKSDGRGETAHRARSLSCGGHD